MKPRNCRPESGQRSDLFRRELVKLCKKHGAVIFARTDGKSLIVSVQIGYVCTDYTRIYGEEATPLRASKGSK